MNKQIKKLTAIAMFSAMAYVSVAVGRIPMVLFLKYDPKDIIITIAGFIYGPLTSFVISLFVSFIEMFTISDNGIIGFFMNTISTCSFACTAAYIYKKKHTMVGAITGLIAGCISMMVIMFLWNYLITPLYMGIARKSVVKLLISAILPFNLIKGGLNASITMFIYKPLVTALRRSRLIPETNDNEKKGNFNLGITLVSGLVLITCIMLVMVMKGVF